MEIVLECDSEMSLMLSLMLKVRIT